MAIAGLIITGSAGFIGMNMLKSFYGHNYDFIMSIDKLGYATQYNRNQYELITHKDNKEGIFRFDCDINDTDKLKSLCKDWWATDWIILDFASNSHVDKSIENPSSLYNENCTIPSNLLACIGQENWSEIRHYYHISTDEVYGDIPLTDRNNRKSYFSPCHVIRPSNPYSASKVAQDMYLTAMNKTFNIPVTLIRMANQFGPWQHPEKMIPASILRALRGETIKIYGDGKHCRQWTYVEDTVNAIHNVMCENPDRMHFYNPPVVHLADENNCIENNELINKLSMSLKRHNIEPKIEHIPDRLGHDSMYALKVYDEDKPFFKTPFDEALDKTVDFYVERYKNGDFA